MCDGYSIQYCKHGEHLRIRILFLIDAVALFCGEKVMIAWSGGRAVLDGGKDEWMNG